MLEQQIATMEAQIVEYKKLLEYQRQMELENAEAQDNQPSQIAGGALYTSDSGEQYRRNFLASHQLLALDQTGAAYVILSNDTNPESYPVLYMTNAGTEEYNPAGVFFLPNYYESVYGNDTYPDIPEVSSHKTIYYDTMTGGKYIDLTGAEFYVPESIDVPSAYDQVENKPDYDPNLASMESQLENYRLQLIQARLQDKQLGSTFTSYLWGNYNQTGEQLSSLMQQFSQKKRVQQNSLQHQLQELNEQLAKNSVITASYSGTVSDLAIGMNDYIQTGSVVGRIIREGDDGTSNVILYVPLDKGKLISEGMEVNVSPATVNREEHGYILGRVTSVSEYAVSQEHMMASLQNQSLVQSFAGQSAVIEVEVELLLSDTTVSGYEWSTPKGAPITIDSGTICSGEIKVSNKRPIDMVIPFIKRLFSGAESEGAQ